MYANKNNSHTAFFTDTKTRSAGCSGLKGGKRKQRRKTKRRRRRKTKRRRRRGSHRGGATMNLLSPFKGQKAMLTRGGNGSRKLSNAEMQTLRGGSQGYEFNNVSAKAGIGQGYHLHSSTPTSKYNSCGITPPEKMGAGVQGGYVGTKNIQNGAGNNDFIQASSVTGNEPITVDNYNQFPAANHGYDNNLNNSHYAGSYPPQSLTYKKGCSQQGGKKGGGSKMTRLIHGIFNAPDKLAIAAKKVASAPWESVHQAGGKRRRKKRNTRRKHKKKRGKSRKQRGGYAQYGSNKPLTWTQQTPNGADGGKWEGQLASPPTYTRTTNCNNNYNHFTGQNSNSPILDQGVQ